MAKKIDFKLANYYQNLRLEMLPYIPSTAKNILELHRGGGTSEGTNLPIYFKFLNTLARGKISDMKYVQLATVAKVQR